MAEKRTKADKALRQADRLDQKARHPAAPKKKAPRAKLVRVRNGQVTVILFGTPRPEPPNPS